MSDYKVSLGVEVRTNEIDKQLQGYKNDIHVGVDKAGITNDINAALNGYKAGHINVNTKLSTEGITKAIRAYKAKKLIKVGVDPDLDSIDGKIAAHTVNTPLRVKVELNPVGIAGQINDISKSGLPLIELGAKLSDAAISTAVADFNAEIDKVKDRAKIHIGVDPNFDTVFQTIENKVGGYTVKKPINVTVNVLKKDIIAQLADFQKTEPDNYILLNARLADGAVKAALSKYNTDNPNGAKVPINISINNPAEFDAELKKRTDAYKKTPVPIPVKLVPAVQGFTTQITGKKIPVGVVLEPDAINTAIEHPPANLSRVPLKVRLDKATINDEIKQLKGTITEELRVGITLDEASANTAILSSKHTAKLGVGVNLIDEDINAQIEKLHPTTPVKVMMQIADGAIDEKTGKQSAQKPITVNVQLNRQSINDEIRAFKPSENNKIRVGVQLDFKSHKDKETKEYIQKGISQQLKEYTTKSKIMVGVELNKDDINQQIQTFTPNAPLNLGIQLDRDNLQNVENQINGLRDRIQQLSNIGIRLGNGNGNVNANGVAPAAVGVGAGQDIQTVRIARGVDDVTRAYRLLINIQSRLSSKQQAIDKLDTTRSQAEIQELSNQIDNLIRRYQRIHQLFDGQFTPVQTDTLNRNFEVISEKLALIHARAEDARRSMEQMNNAGANANGALGSGATGAEGNTADIQVRTQAYHDLLDVLNELNSKRLQLNGLDASSPQSSEKIQKLRLQIEQLDNEYQNLLRSFQLQGIQFTAEQWNNLETIIARVGRRINVVQAGMADKTAINQQTQAYKELLSISKEIGSVEINIAKLRGQGGNAGQIEVLENQLRTLQSTYQNLLTTLDTPLTNEQWSSIYTQIAQTQDKLAALNAQITETIRGSFGAYDNNLASLQNRYNMLAQKNNDIKIGIQGVEQALKKLKDADGTEDLISANEAYKQVLKEVEQQLTNIELKEKGVSNTEKFKAAKESAMRKLNSLFSEGSDAANKYGGEVEQLRIELDNCGNIDGVQNVTRKINALGAEIKRTSIQTKTLGQRIKTQFSKYSTYFSVASVIMYSTRALRSMFEQIKLVDSAMTELKKVTNETDESYNRFLKNAASQAKEIGTTIDGLIASTSDFARLGYGFKDSQELAKVANIYAVVGDEIEGVEDATQSLVSTLAAFKSEMNGMSNSDFAMSIVDKMNEVSNNFAISSGGIGQALQRSASSMAAANNSLDETIAMITAANTVAQNPEKVGNAFKTMSMRIRGAKTELEEAGESTEGMAKSTASLRAEIKALSGIDIMLNENTFKSTYQIMDELSRKWEDLSDIAQATIIELVAGKHQGNVFSSLMANFDIARDALDTSLNSSGSAMAEHEKWSKSLEAQLLKLKAAWQSLSQSFLSSDFLKTALDAVIGLANGLNKLIDTVGVLPTLAGAFVGIRTLFGDGKNKDKGVFTFDKDAKSIRLFGTALTDVGSKYKKLQNSISRYNNLSSKSAKMQETYNIALKNSKTSMGEYLRGLNGAKASMTGYVGHLVKTKAASIALRGATMLLNAALTIGLSFAIQLVVEGVMKLVNAKKELAEKVEEVTSKFKEQHSELIKGKSAFDKEASRYAKLSKGVDALGRNVSLTADEYSEYQNIVNSIAEKIPSLVSGYDSQGNAILNVKGNVEELTEAYEKLIHQQNQAVLSGKNANNIEKNWKNTTSQANDYGFWETGGNMLATIPALFGFDLSAFDMKTDTAEFLAGLTKDTSYADIAKGISTVPYRRMEIIQALQGAGYNVTAYSDISKILEDILDKEPDKIKEILGDYYAGFDDAVSEYKTQATALLSEAFDISSEISGLNYGGISEELQKVAYQTVNSLDFNFLNNLTKQGKTIEQWTKEMLDNLSSIKAKDASEITAAFDLQTKFNGGDISYGDYVDGLKDVDTLIENLSLEPEVEKQLKINLGLDENGIVSQYQNLATRLSDNVNYDFDPRINDSTAKAFLDTLSADELSVAIDVITEMSDNDVYETIQDIRSAIDREILLRGLSVDVDIKAETEGVDALNTALAESKSATGLTAESIGALKARYQELDGYNAAKLFEETANGIRLNSTELAKLEDEYKKLNKQDLDETLEKLVTEYNNLTEEINSCSDASKRADLYAQRDSILKQINDTATLAAQYKGLTSAYNEWQKAQDAGQDRDQYESILSGRKDIEDEMSRGWLDDAAVEYLELLTGQELSTAGINAQIEAYKELNKTIDGTNYKVWDFFTQDEDGNATSKGVYNFFNTVKEASDGTAAYLENGKYHLNFEGFEYNGKVGDAAIAEMLGTSEELVQIILKAAEDAGFVVNIKGEYSDLADLKEEAELANDRMKELSATTYTFNFDSTNIKDLNTQINEAKTMLNNLKNEDGTLKIGVSQEDYRLAQDMISALIYQKQSLDDSAILHVDTSQAKSDIELAIQKLQEFRQYTNTLELQTAIGADTTQSVQNVQSTINYINGLGTTIKAGLGLDATEVQTAIDNVQANINAGIAIKQEDLDVVNAAISSISNEMMVDLDLDTTLIDNYKATEQTAKGTVNWDNNIEKVTAWINQTHEASGTVNWNNNTDDVKTTFFGNGVINWNVSEANGTANASGTAFANGANGRAFKQGNWGINGSGTALGGELGTEILVRDGKWYTIGDNGAEFFKYRQGDIIFNHRQTEELFANGKVTSGGGRGRAIAEGTAFALGNARQKMTATYKTSTSTSSISGMGDARQRMTSNSGSNMGSTASGAASGLISGILNVKIESEIKDSNTNSSQVNKETGSNASTDAKPEDWKGLIPSDSPSNFGKSEQDNFKETIDWVEIAISRIEREVSNLDKTVGNVYKSWAERNSALVQEIGKVGEEISLQEDAAQTYLKKADSVGLSSSYAKKVRDGTLKIEDFEGKSDEKLVEKIKKYQEFYEKYLKCTDAVEELKETEAELYAQRVEYAGKQFDGILAVIEHEKNMLDEYISQSEARGYLVSDQYYNALKTNEQSNLDKLNEQKNAMLAELQTAMASGKIKQGSEAWYDMVASIDDVTRAIAESDTQLLEYDKNIRELHWEQFDLLQERISNVAEEAEFLIELLSNDKLYDDNGKMTEKGLSKMGLHGQNYNTYMNQADRYYQEVYGEGGLQSQVDADPYNQDLINRRDEMLEQQREMILAAEGEKEAIRDMVEEGINLELDALQERIDKYNESIDTAKDLYDYQKRVKEQSEEIASLEKQLTAYGGDTSEEAMAKKQELEVALKSAREELQETEHDRYIAEQEKLLDELYTDYEEILNARLDNIDALMSDMITEINTNASTISTTISTEAQSVGYKLSESMDTIWNKNTVDTNNVLTTYGEGFIQAQTTTNNALSTININLQNMITALNKMAGTKIKSASMSSAANSEQAKTPEPKPQAPQPQQPAANTIKVGGKINAGSAQIYDYAGDKSGERQYFRNDPIYTVLAEKNGYLQVRWHKLSKGTTGWFKKGDVKALATGARRIVSDDVAWTQEKGQEFIVRPSDGAILTPVAKGDSVLNANASSNIWNMANAPAEFIKDNLKLSANSVPNNSNVQSNYTQHLDKVVFNLPNVKNYEELLSAMQKDKNFERLILSMSVDRLAGKSSLAKGKSIR